MVLGHRIGTGWDSHRFENGRTLWLGGLAWEHPAGFAGHSDGDVLLHAVCDALLGALGAGDIGTHFPSSDARWKNAPSSLFVEHAAALMRAGGWRLGNLDATVILRQPRFEPMREKIRARLAALLDAPPERISVKAKTPEGLGLDGAAIAQVAVLLEPA